MQSLPFETLFALAAAAMVLSLTVVAAMTQRRQDRRVPARIRRHG